MKGRVIVLLRSGYATDALFAGAVAQAQALTDAKDTVVVVEDARRVLRA